MEHSQPQKPYYARAWPPAGFSGDYLQGEMRKTSNAFAKCSHGKVLCVASGFALGGALASILGQYLGGGGMFWIVWIFFCFMLIPLVHSTFPPRVGTAGTARRIGSPRGIVPSPRSKLTKMQRVYIETTFVNYLTARPSRDVVIARQKS